jgi:hypothetical protein
LDASSVWFHDQYTAIYRMTGEAISKTAITAPNVFKILNDYRRVNTGNCSAEVAQAIAKVLNYFAPRAVSGHARLGQGREALRILVSSDYTLRDRLRLRFLFHTALTFAALVGGSTGAACIISTLKWFGAFRQSGEISG